MLTIQNKNKLVGKDIINQDAIKDSNKFYMKVIASIEFLKGRGLC